MYFLRHINWDSLTERFSGKGLKTTGHLFVRIPRLTHTLFILITMSISGATFSKAVYIRVFERMITEASKASGKPHQHTAIHTSRATAGLEPQTNDNRRTRTPNQHITPRVTDG